MAIIKCKMCGGDLNVTEGMTVATCEYCGSQQTVFSPDNEKKLTLFSRANRLRSACEFDKAASIYESIVAEFPTEAEAYWGLVLCRYGIEYVDDPVTGKKIPTCHRSSFDSILEDSDFEQAQENADVVARKVYREEAKAIETIRKGILEVSAKEAPYDIFICYKETAADGQRTIDSVLAQDVYDALTEKGYRVFFSRISLEDKLGAEYEPYIFAALNSAKIMLAFGSDYEYFNAVWVKNEWSRFLSLIAAGQKKTLIPCYKGIDAYDMPKEFHRLQGQDLGKVGAIQDLLRGIEKLIGSKKPISQEKERVIIQQSGGPSVDALIKRGNMAIEDEDWNKAKGYFDQVLNMDAECAEAYFGLAKIDGCCKTQAAFSSYYMVYHAENKNIKRAIEYATGELKIYFEQLKTEAEEKEGKLAHKRKGIEKVRNLITTSRLCSVAVKVNRRPIVSGYVFDDSDNISISSWDNILSVSSPVASDFVVGLREDGTLVMAGSNSSSQYAALDWNDITSIAAGGISLYNKDTDKFTRIEFLLGLKTDGTVLAVGDNSKGQCDVQTWKSIIAISAGAYHAVGLRPDGTVIAVGDNSNGQCDVQSWKNIVAISAGAGYTVGLKVDGSVVATGNNQSKQCEVSTWTDIVAISAGWTHTVAIRHDGSVVATGTNKDGECDISDWENIVAISAGGFHTIGLKEDGTIVSTGANGSTQCDTNSWKIFENIATMEQEQELRQEELSQCKELLANKRKEFYTPNGLISAGHTLTAGVLTNGCVHITGVDFPGKEKTPFWNGIIAISAATDNSFIVGLKSDGTVVAAGQNDSGQCEVSTWTNIVGLATGGLYYKDKEIFVNTGFTIGLKTDGTAVAVGDNSEGQCRVDQWRDIVAVSAGNWFAIGLRADGTLVASGNNKFGQCNIFTWDNIIAISSGPFHTVGLKADGTVVAVGRNEQGQCDVATWKDIIAISAGEYYTLGLKSNGAVVAVGQNNKQQCDVSEWNDIIAISAGSVHSVAIRSNGSVVATGHNSDGRCNVSSWRLFQNIETLGAERAEAMAAYSKKMVEQRNQNRIKQEKHQRAAGMIAAGNAFVLGLQLDGTVIAEGPIGSDRGYMYQIRSAIKSWCNIVSLSVSSSGLVLGLKANGTVVSTDEFDLTQWKNIVAVSAGGQSTMVETSKFAVGLKSDGTVVASGDNSKGQCNVNTWTGIVAIASGAYHTIGLKSDGTVVAAGSNDKLQCEVHDWTDIVAISAGDHHTVGLKSNGTVVTVGESEFGLTKVSNWTNIVAIAAGSSYTVGLKDNGTTVATEGNDFFQFDISNWNDIVAISTGGLGAIVGLKSDGSVLIAGQSNEWHRYPKVEWNLFRNFDSLFTDRTEEMARLKERLISQRAVLQQELSTLKGLFSGMRRKEIEQELLEIEQKLLDLEE